MPPVAGCYVAVASARTSVAVKIPCCEVPRGALDSEDGSLHCSGAMAGAGGKCVVAVQALAHVDASALCDLV